MSPLDGEIPMAGATNPASAPTYEQGEKIPGTNLVAIRKLGTGGQGEVYRVWDSVGHTVYVMKILSAELVGQEAERLFLKEVRLMLKLSHVHIVEVVRTEVSTLG